MSTTIVESWSGADLSQLGPIYPFVGSEMLLVLIGVACWLGFHALQAGIERREMEKDAAAARSPERLRNILDEEARE